MEEEKEERGTEVTIEEDKRGRRDKKKKNKEKEREKDKSVIKKVICWNEEAKEIYKYNTEKIGCEAESEELSVDSIWEKLKELVKRSMTYKERKIKKKELGHKDQWDKSYRRKREIKRIYSKWKKGRGKKEEYIESRRGLNNFQRRKGKRNGRGREIKKSESKVQEFINRKRRKRELKENNIDKEEWRRHFMKLLGGMEIT